MIVSMTLVYDKYISLVKLDVFSELILSSDAWLFKKLMRRPAKTERPRGATKNGNQRSPIMSSKAGDTAVSNPDSSGGGGLPTKPKNSNSNTLKLAVLMPF